MLQITFIHSVPTPDKITKSHGKIAKRFPSPTSLLVHMHGQHFVREKVKDLDPRSARAVQSRTEEGHTLWDFNSRSPSLFQISKVSSLCTCTVPLPIIGYDTFPIYYRRRIYQVISLSLPCPCASLWRSAVSHHAQYRCKYTSDFVRSSNYCSLNEDANTIPLVLYPKSCLLELSLIIIWLFCN
jgi:hypothetical protein